MREVEWLKSLDRGAAAGATPVIDVAPEVMRTVRSLAPDDDRVFPLAAAAALLAGCAAAMLVLPSWTSASNPLAALTEAFDLVLR